MTDGQVLVALVALLRGVNVGGHRTFRPSRLAHVDPASALQQVKIKSTVDWYKEHLMPWLNK